MTMRPGHRHGWAVLTGAALLALLATAAPASTPTPARADAKAKRARVVKTADAPPAPSARVPVAAPAPGPGAGSLGLMAFLDPETGQLTGPIGALVPPADQQAARRNVLLTPVQRANGAWLLDLQGTLMEYYVVERDAFGNRRVRCVQDPRQLPGFAPLPAPAAPAGEER